MSLADLLYGGGKLNAPSPEAPSPVPPDAEELRQFIAEARLSLRGGIARWLICVVAVDRPGLVAAISRAIADLELNIEAAHQMTAGGQAILSFTVSSNHQPNARAGLAETLDRAGTDWEAKTYVLSTAPVEEPIPAGSHTQWSAILSGESADHTSKLAEITASVAAENWPVVALNSFVIDGRFDFEMTFATDADVNSHSAAAPLLAVDESVRLRLAPDQIDVSSGLLRRSPLAAAPDDGLLWITGIARPGLLAQIFRVVQDTKSTISIASMAILEGHTVALIGVDVAAGFDPVELRRLIENSAKDVELRAEHLNSAIRSAQPVSPSLSLYSVHVITEERPGVIAEIAERITDVGGDICRIRARVVGTARPGVCEVRLAVWLEPARFNDLIQGLEESRARHDWTTCYAEPMAS